MSKIKKVTFLRYCEPDYKVAVDVPGTEVLPELKRGELT